MPKDTLKRLSHFESHDYVKTWYKRVHGGSANATKISQINACFVQARELHENASSVGISVKPLLLYYSVLTYCRGAILLNNKEKKEESLKPSHGLEEVNWRETLQSGIHNILDLKIRSNGKGTFQELEETCWNLVTFRSFQGATSTIGSDGHNLGKISFAEDRSCLTLGDLLSRLQSTASSFAPITGRTAQYALPRISSMSDGLHIAFPFVGNPEAFAGLSGLDGVRIGSSQASCPGFRQGEGARDTLILDRTYGDKFYSTMPVSHFGSGENMMIISDFPNGDKMIEFFKLYLTSYLLGMLVRYFPSGWMRIVAGGVGDSARPLIFSAIESIERDFPKNLERSLTVTPKPKANP